MMPPTSIDGTDITGATIDGTDVTEITVDGDTVFTAGPTLPVAYSNLIAWYPFDSAEYGGSNADDVTAILGGSGDDTAFNGTVNGASYQSSGGVTDIRAGGNSGAFEFFGGENISMPSNLTVGGLNEFTVCVWFNGPDQNGTIVSEDDGGGSNADGTFEIFKRDFDPDLLQIGVRTNGGQSNDVKIDPFPGLVHIALTFDNGTFKAFADGTLEATGSTGTPISNAGTDTVKVADRGGFPIDGVIDDLRFYNTALSSTQISQIFNNTKP